MLDRSLRSELSLGQIIVNSPAYRKGFPEASQIEAKGDVMRVAAPVNADPTQCVVVNTNEIPWEPTEHPGVSRKMLEFVSDPRKGRETSLLKFEPGARMPAETLTDRLDILVIEGTFSDGVGNHGPHTFIRNPPGSHHAPASKEGCVIYAKWRVPIHADAGERIVIDAKTAQWMAFPHRGADVLHLYPNKDGIETSRIGNVHPNRKLPSHDHSIGEETLVLEGVLKDEYTSYSQGFWFRMPCDMPHAPYTESQNCKMLIREGDLVW
jgi:anti-sigma factor ChrR (cupin superfamily)